VTTWLWRDSIGFACSIILFVHV